MSVAQTDGILTCAMSTRLTNRCIAHSQWRSATPGRGLHPCVPLHVAKVITATCTHTYVRAMQYVLYDGEKLELLCLNSCVHVLSPIKFHTILVNQCNAYFLGALSFLRRCTNSFFVVVVMVNNCCSLHYLIPYRNGRFDAPLLPET